jgi:hypothetical protein
MPLPLWVGRWPDDVAARVGAALLPRLRGRARDVAELSLAAGLGVYLYTSPSIPIRLAQVGLPDARSAADVRARLAGLARSLDLRQTLVRWLELTARLLALGFVSADPTTVVTGDCLQVQNLVLDGGFADVESLVAAADLDDRALRGAVRRTVHELASSATRLLVGLGAVGVDLRDRVPDIYAVVWSELGKALRAEPARDPRIAALFEDRGVFDRLVELFTGTW